MNATHQTPTMAKVFGRLADSNDGDLANLATAGLEQFEALSGHVSLRLEAALRAAGEIDALASVMRNESAGGDFSRLEAILPGMLRRIQELSSVVMSVVGGDTARTTLEMFEVVCADEARAAEVVEAARQFAQMHEG